MCNVRFTKSATESQDLLVRERPDFTMRKYLKIKFFTLESRPKIHVQLDWIKDRIWLAFWAARAYGWLMYSLVYISTPSSFLAGQCSILFKIIFI